MDEAEVPEDGWLCTRCNEEDNTNLVEMKKPTDEFVCQYTGKRFKSLGSYENYLKSKKYKQIVAKAGARARSSEGPVESKAVKSKTVKKKKTTKKKNANCNAELETKKIEVTETVAVGVDVEESNARAAPLHVSPSPKKLDLTPEQKERLAALRAARAAREAQLVIEKMMAEGVTSEAKLATREDLFGVEVAAEIAEAEKQADAAAILSSTTKVKGYRKQAEYGAKKFIKP